MVTRPPEKEAPWPFVVNRQHLLTASWGSKKGADLLWHFLNKARWEIKNQNLSTSVKDIVFQESRPEILKSIESAKAGNSLSQGTYNTLLRAFVEVGYLTNQPYSDTFTVHLAVIEQAFSNPPQKPVKSGTKPKRTHEFDVNLTHHTTDTISREEFNSLVEVCVNVSKMCQCLSIQVAELTQMCQSLYQNPSSNAAPEEVSNATTEVQSNAIEIMLDDNDSPLPPRGENPSPTLFEMLPWLSLDDAMAPTKILVERVPMDYPRREYEQDYRAWTLEQIQQSLLAKGVVASVEYVLPSCSVDSYSQQPRPYANGQETMDDSLFPGYTNPNHYVIPDLSQGLQEARQEVVQETPAQIKRRMEHRKSDVFVLYARLTGVAKVVKSRENQDGADMLVDVDATDEDITIAVEEIQSDPFWSKQLNLRTVATQLQNRVNERLKRTNGNGRVKRRIPTREEDPYSIAALIAEQNPGYFAARGD